MNLALDIVIFPGNFTIPCAELISTYCWMLRRSKVSVFIIIRTSEIAFWKMRGTIETVIVFCVVASSLLVLVLLPADKSKWLDSFEGSSCHPSRIDKRPHNTLDDDDDGCSLLTTTETHRPPLTWDWFTVIFQPHHNFPLFLFVSHPLCYIMKAVAISGQHITNGIRRDTKTLKWEGCRSAASFSSSPDGPSKMSREPITDGNKRNRTTSHSRLLNFDKGVCVCLCVALA